MTWLALRQNFTGLGNEWLSMLEQRWGPESRRLSGVESSRAEGDSGNVNIFLPLWKRGIKGDLKMECPFFLYKISLAPLFQRGELREYIPMELIFLP